jgi:hypothetical protein
VSLFVRVNTSFYSHIKTIKLWAKIGNDAFWVPPRIWAVAAVQRPNGNFDGISAEELAKLIGYSGDAPSMLQALLQAGYMDADPLRIHNWEEHNGYHVSFAERASSAAKARWKKAGPKKGDGDEKRREETSIASGMLQASTFDGLKNEAFSRAWEEWVTFRKKLKGCKDWDSLFRKQLEWFASFPDQQTAITMMDTSIRNGWKGLFEPQGNGGAAPKRNVGPNI